MPRIGTIIILVIIVWNIVAAILQASARKKQEQQMRDLSQRRRQQSAGQPAGSSTGAQSQREQLAARRKAQLEELRASRQSGQQPVESTPTGTGSQWPMPQSAEQSATYAGAGSGERLSGRIRSEVQSRRQQGARRVGGTGQSSPVRWPSQTRAPGQHLEPAPVPHRQSQYEQAPQPKRVRRRSGEPGGGTPGRVPEVRAPRLGRTGVPIGETAVGTGRPYDAYRQRIPGSARARAIREQLMNPQKLRDIYLFKEILDRPVSVRQNIDPYEPL